MDLLSFWWVSYIRNLVNFDFFFNLGIDSEGHAANFVETEQIVHYNGSRASFVQASGRGREAARQPSFASIGLSSLVLKFPSAPLLLKVILLSEMWETSPRNKATPITWHSPAHISCPWIN